MEQSEKWEQISENVVVGDGGGGGGELWSLPIFEKSKLFLTILAIFASAVPVILQNK